MTHLGFASRSPSSNTFYLSWSGLLWAGLATAAAADPMAVADIGTRLRAGTSATAGMVWNQTEVTAAAVVDALQSLAAYLANPNNQGLSVEDKRLLYSNLWDLYD